MPEQKQSLYLENKNFLKITGVEGVVNLTETYAKIIVCGSFLEIKGENITAEKLSVEVKELVLVGNFFEFKYVDKAQKKTLLKRIFK